LVLVFGVIWLGFQYQTKYFCVLQHALKPCYARGLKIVYCRIKHSDWFKLIQVNMIQPMHRPRCMKTQKERLEMVPSFGLFEFEPSRKAFVGAEDQERSGYLAEVVLNSNQFGAGAPSESSVHQIEVALSSMFYHF
jgi:hypothetical protein